MTDPHVRLGVLDIGSNTVHMLVVDAAPGARPAPEASHREVIALMQYLDDDGRISKEGTKSILSAVDACMKVTDKYEVTQVVPMATSALREAPNGRRILGQIQARIGQGVSVLSGKDEARLTFLAVRRWYGWGAGRLLNLDIGGGSLEVAIGTDEEPELAQSVPLGAGRITRFHIPSGVATPSELEDLRDFVRGELKPLIKSFKGVDPPDHVAATSKTFRSLARLAGAQVSSVGPDESWRMREAQLGDWVPRLARISPSQREALPGVTSQRSLQIFGGAIVADEIMRGLDIDEVEICPWALREGAILRWLDQFGRARLNF